MEEQHSPAPDTQPGASTPDVALRLQSLIAGWRGAERGQPLAALHQECQAAVGPGGRGLLPAQVRLISDLDAATLQTALRSLNGKGRGAAVRFRVPPVGRFDAALVPIGPAGEAPDHWFLAIEETLPPRDQVALYAHALGHLLLNRESKRMGQMAPLDPRDGYTHTDLLGELRQVEQTRTPIDRRVLETYPLLASLLHPPEEQSAALSFIAPDFRERLAQSGWRGHLIESPYVFTAGRIFISGTNIRRGQRLQEDALLRAEMSVPIALVHLLRSNEQPEQVMPRLVEYARDRLCLPFAYLMSEDGAVREFDWTSREVHITRLAALPSRDELWQRWSEALGLTDEQAKDALAYPYRLSAGRRLRYYQEGAVNRAVIAVLQAKRGLRRPRLLLTMATGTGKTLVAFEIAWKLKRKARAVKNVLFLTDRDYLLEQAMDNDFAPFGDARYRIRGEVHTSHDLLFATYQAIADQEGRRGLYRRYPRDFFDLVIVDECHRGSADEDSNWRAILDHFESAVQIGLTATPQRTDNIQTYAYFGEPVMTYSLRQGINDGFLAPYRVRRVLLGSAAEAEGGEPAPATGQQDMEEGAATLPLPPSEAAREETTATLRARTRVIAEHLAKYLQSSDPMAKTIVFCVDQQHAEDMRLALAEACAEQVRRYPDYVVRIVSEEGPEGKRALGRFGTPDEPFPVIVTTSKLLGTGVDVPTCKNIVLARPIGSMVEFKQIIGRGTRLHEKKQWFTIIDYAGATHHFFDQAFDGDPELVEVEPLIPEAQPVPAVADTSPTTPGPGPDQPDSAETKESAGDLSPALVAYPQDRTTTNNPGIKDGHINTTKGEPLAPEPLPQPAQSDGSSAATVTAQPEPTPIPAQGQAAPAAGGTISVRPLPAQNSSDGPVTLPSGAPQETAQIRSDGRKIVVVGEIVYELGPDGKTLRSTLYQDYTREALQTLCATPTELRARWLHREQREEIKERLTQEGVDLQQLAERLGLADTDPFDLLLHVAFGERPLTRRERADRLKREHAAFFAQYGPAAREILQDVLAKYLAGEAEDVSDTELLRVPPISGKGTFMELAQRFGSGATLRAALKELQARLYSA